jgi:glutamine amidotransferase
MIVIVDYGMGNLRSVAKALESLGAPVTVSSDAAVIAGAPKLIVPGVGAFGAAVGELQRRGLIDPIRDVIRQGQPYLGICLGLQLLLDSSEESPGVPGFGVIPGVVRRLPVSSVLKTPHMGWNRVVPPAAPRPGPRCPLLEGIPDGSYVYFVHSYYALPTDASVIALESEYGQRFPVMLWRDRLFGTQFHPEKSQALGLRLLQNFARL